MKRDAERDIGWGRMDGVGEVGHKKTNPQLRAPNLSPDPTLSPLVSFMLQVGVKQG